MTHLIFPLTAHWVIIREGEGCRLIPFHVLSQSMTEEHLCLLPAWGAKTTFVPVVTFTPKTTYCGLLVPFCSQILTIARRCSETVRWSVVWREAREKFPQTTVGFS